MKNKIVFFTTIFPGIEKYLFNFFRSLKNQSYTNFDLFIVNDGIDLNKILKDNFFFKNVFELKGVNNPALNRINGIYRILDLDYEYVIFGDADDYFSENRIEINLKYLSKYDIVVNDLDLVKNGVSIIKKKYFSDRIENKQEIDLDFIKDKNIFGLSNTAVRFKTLKILKNIILNKNLIAVDWFLFTKFLFNNNKSIFTNETSTFYRQYQNNSIGFNLYTKKSILKGIEVKKNHYNNFKSLNSTFYKLNNDFNTLYNNVMFDKKKQIKYINFVTNKKIINPFWWENILLPEKNYEN